MIERLKFRVEETFGSKVRTPKDFERLADSVFQRTCVLMSPTTFKRLWGYINEPVTPHRSTLDTLARYAGWNDWEDFCTNDIKEVESGYAAIESIDVLRQLKRGDRLRLTWQPGRVCDIEYLGDCKFRVIAAQATKLNVGDTFSCTMIMEGQPFYLDNLHKDGHHPATYICGRQHGIHFRQL